MSVEAKTLVIGTGIGRVARWISWSVCVLLCAFVALVSYRYLFSVAEAPPVIANNALKNPWLLVHVAGAATALLLGPLQFSYRLRSRFRTFHHWIGRIYVVSCLVGGAAGFVLALGASTGPISTAGFASLAVAWIVTTSLAWRRAMQLRFVEHRAWMIRSFALTFAAVTLRLYLPLAALLSINFVDAYRAISFLAWVPNLVVVELYLRSRNTS
jgi:hypothetical protein